MADHSRSQTRHRLSLQPTSAVFLSRRLTEKSQSLKTCHDPCLVVWITEEDKWQERNRRGFFVFTVNGWTPSTLRARIAVIDCKGTGQAQAQMQTGREEERERESE